MNQRSKPISAAKTESIHLSKLRLAAIVTAVCATALAAVTLAGGSTAAPARPTQDKPTIVLATHYERAAARGSKTIHIEDGRARG